MSSLEDQIKKSAADLATALALPRLALFHLAALTLPSACYTLWLERAERVENPLQATAKLLETRSAALAVVDALAKHSASVSPGEVTVRFAGQDMNFDLARHLGVAVYLTTTWTVYDRLADVCGRLIGTDSVGDAKGPRLNPKLCEHFLTGRGDKDKNKMLHGFSLAKLLPAYAWPAKTSYILRNWLTHEGLELDGVPLFAGNFPSDGFALHNQAMERITKDFAEDNTYTVNCCLTNDPGFPWYDGSILTVLAKCHTEIDTLFTAMVRWSVDSLIGQVVAFSERDRGQLMAVAATSTSQSSN